MGSFAATTGRLSRPAFISNAGSVTILDQVSGQAVLPIPLQGSAGSQAQPGARSLTYEDCEDRNFGSL